MTKNQIEFQKHEETKRHNRADEDEKRKSRITNTVLDSIKAASTARSLVKAMGNHPEWYKLNPTLVEVAAKVPTGLPSGISYPLGSVQSLGNIIPEEIAALDCRPSIGGATRIDEANAIEIAMQSLYADDRAVNAGYANYDPADLGMYILSVVEAYGFAAHIYRGLRIAKSFAERQRAVPNALMTAGGYGTTQGQIESWRNNISGSLARLNLALARLNQFPIPNTMSLLARRVWMYSQVFSDHASGKAQLYIMRPVFVGHYQELDGAGRVQMFDVPRGNISDCFSMLESMINKLNRSQDVGVIAGDLIKAFEYKDAKNPLNGKRFQFPSYTEVNPIEVVYDESVLEQIHNLEIYPCDSLTSEYFDIRQTSTGRIYQGVTNDTSESSHIISTKFVAGIVTDTSLYAEEAPMNMYEYDSQHIISTRKSDIDVDTALLDTRLKAVTSVVGWSESGETSNAILLESSGSEVVSGIIVYTLNNDSSAGAESVKFLGPQIGQSNNVLSAVVANTIVSKIAVLTKFDWFPLFKLHLCGPNATTQRQPWIGDIDNFGLVTKEFLSTLNKAVMFSEFGMKFNYETPRS